MSGLIESPVVFLTGAGISVASGLPTFRGPEPDAVWTQDTMEKGTLAYFYKHPHKQWGWYKDRFSAIAEAKPNAAHLAIAEYQKRYPDSWVITQNIDGLHLDAGSSNVIEVHGSWRKVRCSSQICSWGGKRGCFEVGELFYSQIDGEDTATLGSFPTCPKCRKPLRPHVLWFDESYTSHDDYRYREARELITSAKTIIFAGTSFSVGITELAVQTGQDWSTEMIAIDPHLTKVRSGVKLIRGMAEEILPELLKD